ncbi:hypothetical protein J6590_006668 [Homalodisca vitripennis]|nr:hypothetical protein J6590_006668 [Homalodisca vitripennis]
MPDIRVGQKLLEVSMPDIRVGQKLLEVSMPDIRVGQKLLEVSMPDIRAEQNLLEVSTPHIRAEQKLLEVTMPDICAEQKLLEVKHIWLNGLRVQIEKLEKIFFRGLQWETVESGHFPPMHSSSVANKGLVGPGCGRAGNHGFSTTRLIGISRELIGTSPRLCRTDQNFRRTEQNRSSLRNSNLIKRDIISVERTMTGSSLSGIIPSRQIRKRQSLPVLAATGDFPDSNVPVAAGTRWCLMTAIPALVNHIKPSATVLYHSATSAATAVQHFAAWTLSQLRFHVVCAAQFTRFALRWSDTMHSLETSSRFTDLYQFLFQSPVPTPRSRGPITKHSVPPSTAAPPADRKNRVHACFPISVPFLLIEEE